MAAAAAAAAEAGGDRSRDQHGQRTCNWQKGKQGTGERGERERRRERRERERERERERDRQTERDRQRERGRGHRFQPHLPDDSAPPRGPCANVEKGSSLAVEHKEAAAPVDEPVRHCPDLTRQRTAAAPGEGVGGVGGGQRGGKGGREVTG